MLEKIFNKGNAYFDTYYIYDNEKKLYVGIIEDHCRGVKERYFVGWKFKNNEFIPGTFQPGKTESFKKYEEALEYVKEDYEL